MGVEISHKINQWIDATKIEMVQLDEYNTFKDLGKDSSSPVGYNKIQVHLVYDSKHDGRHTARLLDDAYLTNIPVESVYYGGFPSVVS